MNGKHVIKRLAEQGFQLVRVSGSHHILAKGGVRVTVPVHGTADLKTGTLKSIERQSGVKLS